ncbi:unnamed protein product, partial [Meganyctiphanes norvegica]
SLSKNLRTVAMYIMQGNLNGLLLFLGSSPDSVNETDDNGTTPLMLAARAGKPEICNELIMHGASINAKDLDHWTALTFGAKYGHVNVIDTLLIHDADPEKTDIGGWTPLMWTCYN